MGIDWDGFTWEAFAALATGITAVAGATWVGIRQSAISKRQTEILDRQVKLAEATLRAELFDRRLQTYEATADFLMFLGAMPEERPEHEERIRLFAAKMRESRFLFGDRVYDALHEIWEMANQQRYDRATSTGNFREGERRDAEVSRRIQERISWSLKRLTTLPEVFAEDLNISQIAAKNESPQKGVGGDAADPE